MTAPPPGYTSPAEAAYEEHRRRHAERGVTLPPFERLDDLPGYQGTETRADWAFIARAAAEAYAGGGLLAKVWAHRDRLLDGIRDLAAEVQASAGAGGPHAGREHELAIALRKLPEEP